MSGSDSPPRERIEVLDQKPWTFSDAAWLLAVAKAAVAWNTHRHRYVHGVCENCADDALADAINGTKSS